MELTRAIKLRLFFIALFTMAALAAASVLMAEKGRGWDAFAMFVAAFVLAGAGFAIRRRALNRESSNN